MEGIKKAPVPEITETLEQVVASSAPIEQPKKIGGEVLNQAELSNRQNTTASNTKWRSTYFGH